MPDDRDERALRAILRRGYESKELDYKGPTSWDETTKNLCCGLVKDILGMANTGGGFIVIGVAELATGFSWDGLTPGQLASFDTSRVNRFLQNYAEPPVNALLRKVEDAGKYFVVIEVPPFPDTPHLCGKEYPNVLSAPTLYIRTDNNETAPVRSSADYRLVLERAVRNRSDALLTSFRSILKFEAGPPPTTATDDFRRQRAGAIGAFEELNPLKNTACAGFFETTVFPTSFDPARFPLNTLRAAAERGHVDFRGWPFLFIHPNRPDATYTIADGLETFVNTTDFAGNALVQFWRLQQSGFFYQRTTMVPMTMPSNAVSLQSLGQKHDGTVVCVVDFRETAIYIAEAIHCLTRLYMGLLDDDDEVSFFCRLVGTRGRVLVSAGRSSMPLGDRYECRIPEIEIARRHSLGDWRAGLITHCVEAAAEVYQRFNWPNPNLSAARAAVENMFARRL
jgi:hypothetical protein